MKMSEFLTHDKSEYCFMKLLSVQHTYARVLYTPVGVVKKV